MKLITRGPGFDLKFIVDGFSLNDLSDGSTIVDIGGSTGSTALELARAFPDKNFTFVVQDLPETIASIPSTQANELGKSFMPNDFFTPQPVAGADVYLVRWTLHDWSNACCLDIIRALIPALKKGARVLVMEIVLPTPGSMENEAERKVRAMDLVMFQIENAEEREQKGWRGLFERTD